MDKKEIFQKVKLAIIENLCVAESDYQMIDMQTKLEEDLGADSLDQVELIMRLEDVFSVTLPDDKDLLLETVGDVVDLIDRELKNK